MNITKTKRKNQAGVTVQATWRTVAIDIAGCFLLVLTFHFILLTFTSHILKLRVSDLVETGKFV